MSLSDLLLRNQDAVAKRWLAKTLATYHRDTAAFFAKGKNQFANPVGTTLHDGIHALLGAMLATGKVCNQVGFRLDRSVCFSWSEYGHVLNIAGFSRNRRTAEADFILRKRGRPQWSRQYF